MNMNKLNSKTAQCATEKPNDLALAQPPGVNLRDSENSQNPVNPETEKEGGCCQQRPCSAPFSSLPDGLLESVPVKYMEDGTPYKSINDLTRLVKDHIDNQNYLPVLPPAKCDLVQIEDSGWNVCDLPNLVSLGDRFCLRSELEASAKES